MPEAIVCQGCATQIAPELLNCPHCHRLVHAERLKQLAGEAERAAQEGDHHAALVAWRGALELLPPGSRQHDVVASRIEELGRHVDEGAGPSRAPATAETPQGKAAGLSGRAGV